ncbi:MAG: hypothetical protein EXS18_04565 [Verrucomicrobiae bacterium]|nr:hypothetical protein [Verrucomicrobiae bacterium]
MNHALVCFAIVGVCLTALTNLAVADDPADHRGVQDRPIQLGTSGGNLTSLVKRMGGCCSGTLGALIQSSTSNLFILSNYHVFAGPKGAIVGDPITQPGLIDGDCALGQSNVVANLTAGVKVLFGRNLNHADAAIASVVTGDVDTTGSILGIGQPGSQIVLPTLGLGVKKSGRTSGVTQGTVTAVDVTVVIEYVKSCGSSHVRKATFVNQIIITSSFANFGQGGDSGSLVVEDVDTCPGVVGLLFAGSQGSVVANPITDVLAALDASMGGVGLSIVGCPAGGGAELNSIAAPVDTRRSGLAASVFARGSKAKSKHEDALLQVTGVVGCGVGRSRQNPSESSVEIFVEKDSSALRQHLPSSIDGVPCQVVETGVFRAY